ncbi:hypothetical protein DPMN_191795 [Dreissena polymorpha]|uniref:Uncharacterized protein n=1 Tax=Dreissena polymorpha TaxID=45954 RepID=A0A9D3Y152_DREPO|nr:hypothetical protein DPMN_191795 [Dreissena polymorpha]
MITIIKISQFVSTREPVFNEIQDACDEIVEEHKLRILKEMQLSKFGSKEDCLDFENEHVLPSVPQSASNFTFVIHLVITNEANTVWTTPDQVFLSSVRPCAKTNSLTAASSKSTDAKGKTDCGDKSINMGVSNKSIGLSYDVTDSKDQTVAL